MDAKRILLVEDDERDIELTLTALADANLGNAIMVVRDGQQALDYLFYRGDYADRGNGLPVVMFLDLKLPRVDGMEVLRTMKSDTRLRALPVVMVTSSREEQDIVRSYQLGVNAYVVKPMDFDQFMQAIQQLGLFWVVLNEPPPEPES